MQDSTKRSLEPWYTQVLQIPRALRALPRLLWVRWYSVDLLRHASQTTRRVLPWSFIWRMWLQSPWVQDRCSYQDYLLIAPSTSGKMGDGYLWSSGKEIQAQVIFRVILHANDVEKKGKQGVNAMISEGGFWVFDNAALAVGFISCPSWNNSFEVQKVARDAFACYTRIHNSLRYLEFYQLRHSMDLLISWWGILHRLWVVSFHFKHILELKDRFLAASSSLPAAVIAQ